MHLRNLLLPALLLAASGCLAADDGELTKQDALEQSGKADNATDFCADFGWYGDGECDGFCAMPDPDCELDCPDPNDPSVTYVSTQPLCQTILFDCEDDQTPFTDECGCGCIDDPAPECPDPADPAVHYIGDSDQNPAICQVILFDCEDDQTPFTDECGCGCIDS
jgi:hypothetical protein